MFGITAFGFLARSTTQFLVLITSAWVFDPSEVGSAVLVFSLYHLLWPMFETATVQTFYQISKIDSHSNLQSMCWGLGFMSFLISFLLIPVFQGWSSEFGVTVGILCALAIILRSISTISQAKLLKKLDMKKYILIEQFSYILGFATSMTVCILWNLGILFMILGIFLANLMSAFLYILTDKSYVWPRCNLSVVWEMLSTFSGYLVGSGMNSLVREGNVLLAGFMISTAAAGYYSRAMQLYMLGAFTIGQVFDRLLTPIMRRNIENRAPNDLWFSTSYIVLTCICAPISIFLFFNAEEIILLFYGNGWKPAGEILRILSVCFVFRVVMKVGEACMRAYGLVWQRVTYYMIWVGVLAAAAIPAYTYGLVALAIGEVVGVSVFTWCTLRASSRSSGGLFLRDTRVLAIVLIVVLTFMTTSMLALDNMNYELKIHLGFGLIVMVISVMGCTIAAMLLRFQSLAPLKIFLVR